MTEKKKNEGGIGHLVKIVVVLTAICVGIALLLAFVNKVTKDVIAENAAKQQSEAILALFNGVEGGVEGEKKVAEYDLDGTSVYAVMLDDGVLLGYAVQSFGTGFGGEIRTMVGFNLIGEVLGVKIISMSETPGVGSKTKSDSFLEKYIGKSKEMTVGEDIDGISGATISSKGVTEAVNNAIKATASLDVPTMAEKIGAAVTVDYVKTTGGND